MLNAAACYLVAIPSVPVIIPFVKNKIDWQINDWFYQFTPFHYFVNIIFSYD